jgi:hypothetical protein
MSKKRKREKKRNDNKYKNIKIAVSSRIIQSTGVITCRKGSSCYFTKYN